MTTRRFNGIVLRPDKRGKERSLSDPFLELIDIHGLQLLEEREIQAKRCYPARLGVAVDAPYLRPRRISSKACAFVCRRRAPFARFHCSAMRLNIATRKIPEPHARSRTFQAITPA